MANVPISNLTTTWNNVSTTFTGIKLNVTDTASAAGSLLADFQVNGVSKFWIPKSTQVVSFEGYLSTKNNTSGATSYAISTAGIGFGNSNTWPNSFNTWANSQPVAATTASGMYFSGSYALGWTSSDPRNNNSQDLTLFRDAADTLAQRRGVNAQTHRIYGTYTDASNYRRLTKTMSAGGVAEIKPEGAGTGAGGNVLHISGLPTANPGPGILWNDAGTVKVGT